MAAGLITPGIAAEEISPAGSMTHRDGADIIFFYDIDKGIKLRSYAKGKAEIRSYTYRELTDKTRELDPIWFQEGTGKETKTASDTGMPEPGPAAAPQPAQGEDGQAVPYIPVPGQTSVSDLQDVMPPGQESAAVSAERQDSTPDADNVIDGEYRELDEGTGQEGDGEPPEGYTDVEIRNAASFFEMEYTRMAMRGLQMDTVRQRNFKIALECICKCYGSIVGQECGG